MWKHELLPAKQTKAVPFPWQTAQDKTTETIEEVRLEQGITNISRSLHISSMFQARPSVCMVGRGTSPCDGHGHGSVAVEDDTAWEWMFQRASEHVSVCSSPLPW